jgi:hypothetical protein
VAGTQESGDPKGHMVDAGEERERGKGRDEEGENLRVRIHCTKTTKM